MKSLQQLTAQNMYNKLKILNYLFRSGQLNNYTHRVRYVSNAKKNCYRMGQIVTIDRKIVEKINGMHCICGLQGCTTYKIIQIAVKIMTRQVL